MISVLPVKNENELKELFLKSSIKFSKTSAAVVAKEGEKTLGFCLFDMTRDTVTLLYLEPLNDLPLADGIVRSALHVAAERFIFTAKYEGEDMENLLKKLDFILPDTENGVNMDKLFGGCGCKK